MRPDNNREHRGSALKIEDNLVLLEQIPVGPHKNFAYLVGDKRSGQSAVFDPAWEVEKIIGVAEARGVPDIRFIINTHAHFDHIEGNKELAARTGAKIVMHQSSLAKKDVGVGDGGSLKIGSFVELRFFHTPGHSPESMCIQVNDLALLTGDTLFIGECGRVDLPGGDASALYDSFAKIKSLNKGLIVCPGHDYGVSTSSTLAEQISTNYTLEARSREEFIRFMNSP